ncbi:hypothetical protein BpHYR1_043256 [Brachionus plicatilis]|uniref:Uncharacterized protein n=1 Tax=Brachionus plicatilis TaxID=10195 RepID=A0A3M7P9L5_BRAPC|nr:hypothetical protein BpHYR1_043256 [Brachionus plicatilis]
MRLSVPLVHCSPEFSSTGSDFELEASVEVWASWSSLTCPCVSSGLTGVDMMVAELIRSVSRGCGWVGVAWLEFWCGEVDEAIEDEVDSLSRVFWMKVGGDEDDEAVDEADETASTVAALRLSLEASVCGSEGARTACRRFSHSSSWLI